MNNEKAKILVGLERWQQYFNTLKEVRAWNHAYLISGPRGVGKKELAWQLIKDLLCKGDTEEKCESCKAWRKNEQHQLWHPDLIILKPDTKTGLVTIDIVRDFLHEVSSTPVVSSRRVALLPNLSLLNIQGFNALLKTLEEPPPHLTVIGLVRNINSLPKTIVSRAHHCAISPTNYHDLTGYLALSHSREDSRKAADLSYGRPAWAGKILNEVDKRNNYLTEARHFIKDALENQASAFSSLDGIISVSDSKQSLAEMLDHWQLIVRDVILLKSGVSGRVGHSQFTDDLEKLAERGTISAWKESLDTLLQTTDAIKANGNKRVQLGKFILSIPQK